MPDGRLDAAARRRALEAASSGELDLLVVGGGITGVGTALDAATRGLRVVLVEARDLASGTSSASSKLIHGGLRYLEMGDIGLVREALRERELMLTRIAPHLVAPFRSCGRCAAAAGSAPTSARGSRSTTRSAERDPCRVTGT